MNTKSYTAYHNFRTDETDWLQESPDDWRDYIPQDPPALGMYDVLLKMGESPVDAAKRVLSSIVGEE